MEYRFADQPQEVVCSCPELGYIRQTLCSVVEEINFADYISKTEYKTAADEGRDQRGENLTQGSHDLLKRVLIRLCRCFYSIFAHTFDSSVCCKFIIEYGNIISDDNLILTCLCKCAFYTRQIFDLFFIRFTSFLFTRSKVFPLIQHLNPLTCLNNFTIAYLFKHVNSLLQKIQIPAF